MDYETVVFDTAPTGHTLRLLQIPATLDKALGKLSGMQSSFGGLIGQVTAMIGGPADGANGLMAQMDQLKVLFRTTSPFRTSLRAREASQS